MRPPATRRSSAGSCADSTPPASSRPPATTTSAGTPFEKSQPPAVRLIDDRPAAIFAALREVDLVLIGGGPIKEGPMLSAWADAFVEAGRLGVGRMIYGCGIGPIKSPRSARELRRLFAHCDAATVRDARSLKLATQLNADTSAMKVAADPAVAFDWQTRFDPSITDQGDPPATPSDSPPVGGVGISFRYLARDYHQGPGRPAAVEAQAMSAYVQLINHLHAQNDPPRLWLIPMQLDGDRNDYVLLNQLRDQLQHPDRATMLTYDGPADLVRRLRNLDAVVGMRFHSLVLSWLAGTPAVGIDYDMHGGKVTGVMVQMQAPQLLLPIAGLTGDRLIAHLQTLRGDLDRWRQTVSQSLEAAQHAERLSAAVLNALAHAVHAADPQSEVSPAASTSA